VQLRVAGGVAGDLEQRQEDVLQDLRKVFDDALVPGGTHDASSNSGSSSSSSSSDFNHKLTV
jgi:hypothetical protein